ncbi:hypothetical protein VTK56DRAFT_8012 [Thermocarpiscus australiensis]
MVNSWGKSKALYNFNLGFEDVRSGHDRLSYSLSCTTMTKSQESHQLVHVGITYVTLLHTLLGTVPLKGLSYSLEDIDPSASEPQLGCSQDSETAEP